MSQPGFVANLARQDKIFDVVVPTEEEIEVKEGKRRTVERRVFPGYIEDFQRLEAMAPPEDLPRLKLLTEHEVAAVEFLNLEISGEKNSVEPMMNYLRMDIE